MNVPPYLMRLRIHNESRRINLWLPIFLIAPLIIAIAIAFLPIVLIMFIILRHIDWGKSLIKSGLIIIECLSAARGLEANVIKNNEQVFISFR